MEHMLRLQTCEHPECGWGFQGHCGCILLSLSQSIPKSKRGDTGGDSGAKDDNATVELGSDNDSDADVDADADDDKQFGRDDDDDEAWEKFQNETRKDSSLEAKSKDSHVVHCPYFSAVRIITYERSCCSEARKAVAYSMVPVLVFCVDLGQAWVVVGVLVRPKAFQVDNGPSSSLQPQTQRRGN